MHPVYETRTRDFEMYESECFHVRPHMHRGYEMIYMTAGEMELGVGVDYWHLEKGDFAIVFPEQIHHYQVFSQGKNRCVRLIVESEYAGTVLGLIGGRSPKSPRIGKDRVHADIPVMLKRLHMMRTEEETEYTSAVRHSMVEIILARAVASLELTQAQAEEGEDIVYRAVAYMAANYMNPITAPDMARDLGINQTELSRVFSRVFHTNFNKYLNNIRLDHAQIALKHSGRTITEICYESGFNSIRTFNRSFKERFRVSPAQYRKADGEAAADASAGEPDDGGLGDDER